MSPDPGRSQAGGAAGAVAPDVLRLRGLRGRGHHGVYDFERRDGQDFVVDVDLGLDTSLAAADDDLSATVNYGDLAKQLHEVIVGEPVDLIETLAHRLALICLSQPLVAWVDVTVHKPDAPIPLPFDDVSLTIHRRRHD